MSESPRKKVKVKRGPLEANADENCLVVHYFEIPEAGGEDVPCAKLQKIRLWKIKPNMDIPGLVTSLLGKTKLIHKTNKVLVESLVYQLQHLKSDDSPSTGTLTIEQFQEAFSFLDSSLTQTQILELGGIISRDDESTDCITFTDWLRLFRVLTPLAGPADQDQFLTLLFEKSMSVQDLFSQLDTDQDGQLCAVDLLEGFRSRLHLDVEDHVVYNLAASMDACRNGKISLPEWLHRFRRARIWEEGVIDQAVKAALLALYDHRQSLKSVFQKFASVAEVIETDSASPSPQQRSPSAAQSSSVGLLEVGEDSTSPSALSHGAYLSPFHSTSEDDIVSQLHGQVAAFKLALEEQTQALASRETELSQALQTIAQLRAEAATQATRSQALSTELESAKQEKGELQAQLKRCRLQLDEALADLHLQRTHNAELTKKHPKKNGRRSSVSSSHQSSSSSHSSDDDHTALVSTKSSVRSPPPPGVAGLNLYAAGLSPVSSPTSKQKASAGSSTTERSSDQVPSSARGGAGSQSARGRVSLSRTIVGQSEWNTDSSSTTAASSSSRLAPHSARLSKHANRAPDGAHVLTSKPKTDRLGAVDAAFPGAIASSDSDYISTTRTKATPRVGSSTAGSGSSSGGGGDYHTLLEKMHQPTTARDRDSGGDELSFQENLDALAMRLRSAVQVRDVKSLFQTKHDCFEASSLIEWLEYNADEDILRVLAMSEDVELRQGKSRLSRANAKLVAHKCLTLGLFHTKDPSASFGDSNVLCRFAIDEGVSVLNMKKVWRGHSRPACAVAADLLLQFATLPLEDPTLLSSDAYTKFVLHTAELQSVQFELCSEAQCFAFLVSLYNLLVLHGVVVMKMTSSKLSTEKLKKVSYRVGKYDYNLSDIRFGIRKGLTTTQSSRLCLSHLACSQASAATAPVRLYSPHRLDSDLAENARDLLSTAATVVPGDPVVVLPKVFSDNKKDFGNNKEDMLRFVAQYLPSNLQAYVRQLADDGNGKIKFSSPSTACDLPQATSWLRAVAASHSDSLSEYVLGMG